MPWTSIPRPATGFAALAALACLLLVVGQAHAQSPDATNTTTYPTLAMPCTITTDCSRRHSSLYCDLTAATPGVCAVRSCGLADNGVACSLFNATTYCTSLRAGGGTCSPRVARNSACNPLLEVPAGQYRAPFVPGFKNVSDDNPAYAWVAHANQQCEVGLYCHAYFKMCVGTDVDPAAQTLSSPSTNGSSGSSSLGTIVGVLAMAVFVCGCCMLSFGRMCGWQPGQKGGMRWTRVCCGLPGALAQFVRWVCCCATKRRKPKSSSTVGLEEKKGPHSLPPTPAAQSQAAPVVQQQQSQPPPSTQTQQIQQYSPQKQHQVALQQPPPAPVVHMNHYDPRKQHQFRQPPPPPANHYNPQQQQQHFAAGPHSLYPSSSSSSSSTAHPPRNPYAQPMLAGPAQFDPQKHAGEAAYPVPVTAMPTAPPVPATAYPAAPSAAHLHLGKHELGMPHPQGVAGPPPSGYVPPPPGGQVAYYGGQQYPQGMPPPRSA